MIEKCLFLLYWDSKHSYSLFFLIHLVSFNFLVSTALCRYNLCCEDLPHWIIACIFLVYNTIMNYFWSNNTAKQKSQISTTFLLPKVIKRNPKLQSKNYVQNYNNYKIPASSKNVITKEWLEWFVCIVGLCNHLSFPQLF